MPIKGFLIKGVAWIAFKTRQLYLQDIFHSESKFKVNSLTKQRDISPCVMCDYWHVVWQYQYLSAAEPHIQEEIILVGYLMWIWSKPMNHHYILVVILQINRVTPSPWKKREWQKDGAIKSGFFQRAVISIVDLYSFLPLLIIRPLVFVQCCSRTNTSCTLVQYNIISI